MSTRARRQRGELCLDAPPFSTWPRPDVERDVAAEGRAWYFARCRAVEMWVAGETGAAIEAATGVSVREARKLAERAVRRNPRTQHITGLWVCVNGFRTRGARNQRREPFDPELVRRGKGMSSALDQFFVQHPDIKRELSLFVEKRRTSSTAPASLLTPGRVYEAFIGLCRKAGLAGSNQWPFNTKRGGYESIRRWYHKERWTSPIRAASNAHGEATGDLAHHDFKTLGSSRMGGPLLAYERCELDEHHIDAMWEVAFPLENGQFATIRTSRVWGLCLVDCGSTAILACGISYRERYDRSDVMRLVQRAIAPPPRRQLRYDDANYCYAPEAAFPAELPDLRHNTWQTLAFDADASHISPVTLSAIQDVLGCHIASERVGDPTARSFIEAVFGNLTALFQAAPSATGNRPDSPARRNPEAAAQRWHFVAPIAEELLDVYCRNYNSRPSAACQGLSPLQKLEEMLARGEVFRSPLGDLGAQNLWRLLPVYPAHLTKSRSTGPLGVNLFGARYVSHALASDQELMYASNTAVRVYVQEDARFAFVVPEAAPAKVFQVTVAGRYSAVPHTLEWRRLSVNAAKNMARSGIASAPQTMFGVASMLGEAAKTEAPAAALLSGIAAFMDRYGGGNGIYVGSTPQERERLAEWASRIQGDEAAEEGEAPSPAPVPIARVVLPVTRAPTDKGTYDPFGLL